MLKSIKVSGKKTVFLGRLVNSLLVAPSTPVKFFRYSYTLPRVIPACHTKTLFDFVDQLQRRSSGGKNKASI